MGKAKIAWPQVCKPKREGGLGLKSILDANKVFCFKLIWRIVSKKNSLWVSWIQRELIRSKSFWSVMASTSKDSWIWKKLLKYRAQAKDYHQMQVKNGLNTSFWYDHWSPMGRFAEAVGERGFMDMGINSEASVAEALISQRRRRHRVDILNQMELLLNRYQGQTEAAGEDVALWRKSDGNFKPTFSSSQT